jgi:hypothetical protein
MPSDQMPARILAIAGIHFLLIGADDIVIEERDIAYQNFWVDGIQASAETSFDIHLRVEEFPDLSDAEKMFDTRESWSMFRQNESCWIVFKPPHFEEAIRLVRFVPDFSAIDLYLNPKYVTHRKGRRVVANPLHYPVDQLLLMYIMAKYGGILVHGAGAAYNRSGVVFAGKSGAGKSTLSKQLEMGKGWQMISDDRMILRKIDGQYRGHGTPWPGEAGHALNHDVSLKKLMFLHHGDTNGLEPLTARTAFERLIHVTSIPWYDRDIMPVVLQCCRDLVDAVPAFDLTFTPDRRVAGFLAEAVDESRYE